MMQSGQKRIGLRFHGRVQGVGFRWFVLREAERCGVHGWVRNAADGSVELRAEGDARAIDEFSKTVERGPDGAHVTSIAQLPESSEPLPARFEIAR